MAVFDAPSATNGYTPTATGQVIAFVRKPKNFKTINSIVQYTPSDLPTGIYAKLDPDNGVRVSNENQFVWADGADLPSTAYFTSRFTTAAFGTVRRAYPWMVGNQAQRNARLWNPKLTHMMEAISLAMTFRTKRLVRLITNSANWGANTSTATLLGGGKFTAGTVASPFFKLGLLAAAAVINSGTNGIIEIDDLVCVLGRDDARMIGSSAEIMSFLSGSVWTQQMIRDPFAAVNLQWSLPDKYQGIKLVVSTEPQVTENMNQTGNLATTNRSLIWPSGTAVIVARPGTMDNELSEKSYSALQVFHYAGLKAASEGSPDGATKNGGAGLLEVKSRMDAYMEKTEGAVCEQTGEYIAAQPAGYCVTGIV